jgi:oligopeptidase B
MLLKYIFSLTLLVCSLISEAQLTPPVVKKQPKVFNEHGNQRVDDYFWLSDKNDSNVINHLKAENAYFEASLKNTEALQQKIYDELVARIPQRDVSLPTKRNGYWYYTRFEEGKQYPYYARKKAKLTASEEIVLDVPAMASNHNIYIVTGYNVSPNGQWLAYGIDTMGDRLTTLRFKNLQNGMLADETIANTSGNTVWFNDNRTVYYVVNDYTVRPYKVIMHVLGTPPWADIEIYTEKDSTYRVGLSKSKDNKYIFISSNSTNTSEYRFIDADNPAANLRIIQPRIINVKYYPQYFEGDVFHITTNKDATNFRIVTAPVSDPSIENWKDLIPHNPAAYLENFEVLKNYYILQTKEKGLTQIKIFDRKKNQWNNLNFGQDAYVANMSVATDDYASDSIRYNFTSLTTPSSTYLYNLVTKQKKLLKQQQVGNKFNPALYETKRIWANAGDGTKIPVSIVYRKDKFRKDGTLPLYLYAYGSYGANSDPYFSPSVISLLDRGISYAIAHIRGGQELGREWYEQGRILTKKNTFTDFINAAEYLISEKYTSADRLFANGGSAGGMLMGAITNMRPDLFRGIIAEVPWMDVITDMFNTDLPLTTLEYDEWGDPNKPEHYNYMLTWSPLDNVKPAKYPAIFATGGLNDTQVPYFSPAKWVAKIRENNLGTNPVLFRVEMGAGHGGQSGRFLRQKLTALKYTFVLDQLGWNEETKTFNSPKAF